MATSSTRQMIALLMKDDPTITDDVRTEVLHLIDGKATPGLTDTSPIDRTLTRDEVASIMGIGKRTVCYYAKRGIIRPLRHGAMGKRAVGYSEQSVRAAMAGGAVPAAVAM